RDLSMAPCYEETDGLRLLRSGVESHDGVPATPSDVFKLGDDSTAETAAAHVRSHVEALDFDGLIVEPLQSSAGRGLPADVRDEERRMGWLEVAGLRRGPTRRRPRGVKRADLSNEPAKQLSSSFAVERLLSHDHVHKVNRCP